MADSSKATRRDMLGQALQAIEKLEDKLANAKAAHADPIAIIGLACRFPGADSSESYWQLLEDGTDAVSKAPLERWEDEDIAVDMSNVFGGFLQDLDKFDAAHFGVSGREAESMDPQQRLMLETSWEAIEHAGIAVDTLRNSAVGVFVGITTNDYARMAMSRSGASPNVYTATGGALNVAAGRVSYALGFNGPALSVDTACSSSLVALHLACQSLRDGDCEAALAGGVNVLLSAEAFACFNDWGMMAPDGRCKTFDEKADGFVRSEGCGVLLLKRLSDAEAAGDNILAVIRGTAVNQDGASSGLTVPNGLSQEAVLRAALSSANVAPRDIDVVEAHGTGTTLGDPIEMEALARVLGKGRPAERPLYVGSVKTNIGHAESASGVAGLIKLVLSMQHGMLPRHLHFSNLNPRIAIGDAPLRVPTANTPWPRGDRPRIAGVSSFGFSGTNAHVIVEEGPPVADAREITQRPDLLVLSARNDGAISQLAADYRDHLLENPDVPLADVCFSLATGRARLAQRVALVADEPQRAAAILADLADGRVRADVSRGVAEGRQKVAFLFTGQGSQRTGMGRELFETEQEFRAGIERCAAVLGAQLGVSLEELLGYSGDPALSTVRLDETEFTQPALFAFEYALACLWRAWGIEPAAMVGHSIGEYVAACIAGVMSLEEALALVVARARLMQKLPRNGAMAAVFADEQTVAQAIAPASGPIAIAALNAPMSTVISGDAAEVEKIQESMQSQGIDSRDLHVSHAFHSPLMRDMLEEFREHTGGIAYESPQIDLVLNVSGEFCAAGSLDSEYWISHVMQPVQFMKSVRTLHERGITNFLEIGPSPVLTGLAGQILADGDPGLFASAREGTAMREQMLESLGGLFVRGIEPDWRAVNSVAEPRRTDLPRYAFQRKHFWLQSPPAESSVASVQRPGGAHAVHPFLGYRVATPLEPEVFECSIRLPELPGLRDHRIAGVTLFPAAAYMEMGRAAAAEWFGRTDVTVSDGWFREPLVLDDDGLRQIQLIVTPKADGDADFEVWSRMPQETGEEPWVSHAGGTLQVGATTDQATETPEDWRQRCTEQVDVAQLKARMLDVGLEYGPSFNGLVSASRGEQEACGRIELPGEDELVDRIVLHPGILDAAFHLLGVAIDDSAADDDERRFYLPFGFESAVLYGSPGASAEAHVRLRHSDATQLVADISVWHDDGTLVAEVLGLKARGVSKSEFRSAIGGCDEPLHEIVWRDAETGSGSLDSDSCLVVGAADDLRTSVTEGLQQRGIVHETSTSIPDEATAMKFDRIIDLRACDADAAGSEQSLEAILDMIRQAAMATPNEERRLLIVTRGAQALATGEDVDPVAAAVWGLAATAAAELAGTDVRIIDIDDGAVADRIVDVATRDSDESRFACREGKCYVPRLVQVESQGGAAFGVPDDVYALKIQQKGTLSGIELKPARRVAPRRGQVEIEVLASGINFRDVLNVLDMYPGPAGELGNECCGRVVSLGPGVESPAVGTIVTCIAEATYGSHVISEADLAFAVPDSLSLAQAAVFPIAQLTSYLSLHEIGRMKAGDRVLIHAAAGGVGLAAVHLALAAGAEVIATAGSEQKRDFLRNLGVTHVFDSRTTLDSEIVLDATDGHGVDLVLNSLIGESIDAGLASLASGGRFLEIGMREIRKADEVASIRSDISYYPILLGDYCRHDPDLVRRMYERLVGLLADGSIPAPLVRSFPVAETQAAFEFMAKALHTGRLAVTHPALGRSGIRDDASYLVTGGMGALGLAVAEWLVTQGAAHVILTGRSAPGKNAERVIQELRSRGASVEVSLGDIADEDGLPDGRDTGLPPVRGVIHAAGVVDDAIVQRVDSERLQRVLRPKTKGTANLVRATADTDLDFLVFFSSGSSILGSPGQIAYSAANAYLDGTAHHLRSLGRAAVSINWGAWQGDGMVARADARMSTEWAARGIGTLSHEDGMQALEAAIGIGRPQLAVLPIDWSKFFASTGAEAVPTLLSELRPDIAGAATETPDDRPSLVDSLVGLSDKQRLTVITREVRKEVAAVLGVAVDEIEVRAGLTEQGMDSLMAVELAGRLGRLLGLTLATTFAFDHPTLGALAAYLDEQVRPDAPAANGSAEEINGQDTSDLGDLDDLSEQDLEAALRRELEQTEIMER
jgi:acyl transferase domain-containing protein/acyl carrier protein